MKTNNELKLVIDGKEVDLAQFFKQEEKEEAHADTGAIEDTDGKRTSYNCVLHKGVKNKQTDQWDEYKIALFDDQILPTAELLRIAFAAIIKAKSNPRSGQPVTTQGDQRLDEIGDDIPF